LDLAAITQADVIVAILAALHLPTEAPVVQPQWRRWACPAHQGESRRLQRRQSGAFESRPLPNLRQSEL